MHRFRDLIMAFVFTAAACSFPAVADSPAPPVSYMRATSDEKHVFVMIAPDPEFDEGRRVRELYPVSGLYKRNETSAPVWTVDWYSHEAIPASDGIHLVRPGPWPTSADDPAVSFYATGKLIREYKINELVAFPHRMPRSVSHFQWCKMHYFDDTQNTYTVITLHAECYVFDVKTGTIVSWFSPFLFIAPLGSFVRLAAVQA